MIKIINNTLRCRRVLKKGTLSESEWGLFKAGDSDLVEKDMVVVF